MAGIITHVWDEKKDPRINRALPPKAKHDLRTEFNRVKFDNPNYPMIPLLTDLAEKYNTTYQQAYDVCV